MINFIIYITDIHREFQDGSTMLHLACAANNFEAVLYLETSGIDINREDKKGNMYCKYSFVYFYLLFSGKLGRENTSLLTRLLHKMLVTINFLVNLSEHYNSLTCQMLILLGWNAAISGLMGPQN